MSRKIAFPISKPRQCMLTLAFLSCLASGCSSISTQPPAKQNIEGYWLATLDSPGGELWFGIEISRDTGDEFRATIRNGHESIHLDAQDVSWDGTNKLSLHFPHYDSTLLAEVSGGAMHGQWLKTSGDDTKTRMQFTATKLDARPDQADIESFRPFLGRWRVNFESAEDVAVGVMSYDKHSGFQGTFLTTTGDYRFLDGKVIDNELWLSCFDGAHAFLFRMSAPSDDRVTGDFWSRDSWHETWTAQRDDEAVLPDAFEETSWDGDVSFDELVFPDLDGNEVSLANPEWRGDVTLYHVFGSWCPNCHDAGKYLSELLERYGERGLKVVGVAFELTSDHERNAQQVKEYLARHDVNYPVVIAGPADKAEASARFPLLDRIRSYPTTIFVDRDGVVRHVHTGFTGPATGEAYKELQEEWKNRIDAMLR